MPDVIAPGIDRGNDWFWAGVRDHQLLIQRCASCGLLRRHGVPMCGSCHSVDSDAQSSTGRGTIHSWIVSRHPNDPDEPRIVVLVELEEGIRFVSNLVDATPDEVENDLPVELGFVDYDGVTLPQFRLVR